MNEVDESFQDFIDRFTPGSDNPPLLPQTPSTQSDMPLDADYLPCMSPTLASHVVMDDKSSRPSSSASERSYTPIDGARSTVKRTHQERASDTPPTSPTKKRGRTEFTRVSAIRSAIQSSSRPTQKPRGLLQYFQPSTKSEHEELLARTREELDIDRDDDMRQKEILQHRALVSKRHHSTERKRKQREKQRGIEIAQGKRSPGGTKISVRVFLARSNQRSPQQTLDSTIALERHPLGAR